jgi:hypothetical protein
MPRSRPLAMLTAAALAVAAGSAFSAEDGVVVARIDISPKDGSLDIDASAVAVSGSTVTGEVSIEKSGPSGNVSLRQQRTLTLAAGESGAIGRTGLSFAKGDLLEVSIVLRVGEMVVAQASSTVGSR